ncbi:MAG: squalene/phytoene synthase family protein [Bacteroidota bacterium]
MSTFYYSFLFLPKQKREAISLVYAWCRATDDIVDSDLSVSNKRARLLLWAKEFDKAINHKSDYPILNRVGKIISEFNIPVEHFHELISGMEMDLTKTRYETFDELLNYSYRVASSVGLMCTEIFGYSQKQTIEYSKMLGYSLQLTNILRDIKNDAKRNRIYLPLSDLRKFNYSETDLINNLYDERFIALMKFQFERTKNYFLETKSLLSNEDKPLFIAAEIMRALYFEILLKIEKCNFDVFNNNVRLSSFKKISIASKTWWQLRNTNAV